MQHKIALAERRKAEVQQMPLPIAPRYEMSDADIAHRIYATRLDTDERIRNHVA